MIILTLKVTKELSFANVRNGKEQGMKTLHARNQLQSFHFKPQKQLQSILVCWSPQIKMIII